MERKWQQCCFKCTALELAEKMEEINGKGMRTKGQAVGETERRREKGGEGD